MDLVALRTRMIVIGVVCIILLCILIERMTHIVVKPVKEITKAITQMASGDFTVSVNPRGNDEIAVMGYSGQPPRRICFFYRSHEADDYTDWTGFPDVKRTGTVQQECIHGVKFRNGNPVAFYGRIKFNGRPACGFCQ